MAQTRAANGQGSIRSRNTKTGTVWDVQVSVKEAHTGRPIRLSKRGFDTQKKAIDWVRTQNRKGRAGAKASIRVSECIDMFWAEFEGPLNTRRSYTAPLKYLGEAATGKRMRSLSPKIIETAIRRETRVTNTMAHRRTAIRRFLRWAEDRGMVDAEVRQAVTKMELGGVRSAPVGAAARQQIEALLALDSEWVDLWATLANTGIRSSEARALTDASIVAPSRLLISGSAGAVKGDPVGETKNKRSRIVAAPLFVTDMLAKRGPGFLFQVGGEPISHSLVGKRLNEDCDRAGVERFAPHQFRHYWATEALKKGVNAKVVSEQLGHSSIRVTLDVYTSIAGEDLDRAASLVAVGGS